MSELDEKLLSVCLSMDATAADLAALLAEGADPNADDGEGSTPLHYAATADWNEDDDGRMQLLFDAGADPERRCRFGPDWTPLMAACHEGHAAQVKCLLANGADPNAVSKRGTTALMVAAGPWYESEDKVRLLLAAGADPHLRDNLGRTAVDNGRSAVETWGAVHYWPMDDERTRVVALLEAATTAGGE